MSGPVPLSTTASNAFEDLSGISTSEFSNPYDALISVCENDVSKVQSKYMLHRTTRNAQQKAKLLDLNFPGVTIDPILSKLVDPTNNPGYEDPRHCLVLWGRPTEKVKALLNQVQQKLLTAAPNIWLMPQDCLHITALEVVHSKTAEEIHQLVEQVQDKVPAITDYTFGHRTRLIKPLIGYDGSALAMSFVPAAGEGLPPGRSIEDDKFTYHHLRRDLFGLCRDIGIHVDSRYVVPSSHMTICRFVNLEDFADQNGSPSPQKMKVFIEKIEEINNWLEKEFWPEHNGGKIPDGGEFDVGKETGLLCRRGKLWYGGGETVHSGKGY